MSENKVSTVNEHAKGVIEDSSFLHPLHGLILARVYHEDQLLFQRTAYFVATNAFLMTALTLSFGGRSGDNYAFSYAVIAIAFTLSLIQIFLGFRSHRAVAFWRAYLNLIEGKMGISIDAALYDFYTRGRTETAFGIIKVVDPPARAMYKVFPWSIKGISANIVASVVVPALIAMFWIATMIIVLWKADRFEIGISCGVAGFLVLAAAICFPPSPPQAEIMESKMGEGEDKVQNGCK